MKEKRKSFVTVLLHSVYTEKQTISGMAYRKGVLKKKLQFHKKKLKNNSKNSKNFLKTVLTNRKSWFIMF